MMFLRLPIRDRWMVTCVDIKKINTPPTLSQDIAINLFYFERSSITHLKRPFYSIPLILKHKFSHGTKISQFFKYITNSFTFTMGTIHNLKNVFIFLFFLFHGLKIHRRLQTSIAFT